jgi:DNA-binding MarR family transcriptional regulator
VLVVTSPPRGPAAGLLLAGQYVAAAIEQRLRAERLSAAEALLLVELRAGPLTMNAVRQALAIEKSTATSLIDRLERRDLVSRRANPADGRSLLVYLSRSGQRAARKSAAAIEAVDEQLSQVSDSALRGHRQVIQRLQNLA